MERTCCGRPCETPFCPHCAKAMGPAQPLDGLLEHCRRVATIHRKSASRWRDENPGSGEKQAQAARHDLIAARWQSWHDALAALIHGEDGPHGGFQSPPQDGPAT
jgi:hypothetical protein